ncbi:enterobactin transporter EntS [Streptomyces sp. NBC_00690]|uniref:enterobactin transporter EntS n=1 Tax=Streptomyces sp. NBC_00690 TaxID=2975808 RepID=UPI002E2C7015|nr:enterobactin transporter EntS [Streptomyces sp. NBC_00690]
MSVRDYLIDIEPLRTSPDFRSIFVARVVSLFGLGMASVALAAQVYDLTESIFQIAVTSMIMSVTVLIGSLWGGVMADRMDRKRLIVYARGAAAFAFAGLAWNALSPDPKVWVIFLCVAWDGLATGVSVTALMAVAPTLVRPDQLPAAGALISLTGEIGSIAAPLLGGVLLALWGPGPVFAFAAVTTAITTFLISRIRPLPPVRGDADGADDDHGAEDSGSLLVAFKYAWRNKVVGGLLTLGGVTALFTMPVVVFPAMVDKEFGGGDVMLGVLYTASAVGSVIVSATSGWLTRAARPGRLLLIAAFVGGLSMIGFGLSGNIVVAVVMLAICGGAGTVYEILEYALVQHNTPDRLRGRIVSVITTQDTAGDIVGDAEVALIAKWFSPSGAAVVNGVICAITAVAIAVAVPGLRQATLPKEAWEDDDEDPDEPPAADGSGEVEGSDGDHGGSGSTQGGPEVTTVEKARPIGG